MPHFPTNVPVRHWTQATNGLVRHWTEATSGFVLFTSPLVVNLSLLNEALVLIIIFRVKTGKFRAETRLLRLFIYLFEASIHKEFPSLN
jgi:hypothetical protein